jgi:hypothetical protein
MSLLLTSQGRILWKPDNWSNLSSQPSLCGSSQPLNLSCSYFPSPGMHNWNRHTQELADCLQWLPVLWRKEYYGGKGQVEATRTASPFRSSKAKVMQHFWRESKTNAVGEREMPLTHPEGHANTLYQNRSTREKANNSCNQIFTKHESSQKWNSRGLKKTGCLRKI